MRNLTKLFLSIIIVILLVMICQNIQITDSNSLDSDYFLQEEMAMAVQYLYFNR